MKFRQGEGRQDGPELHRRHVEVASGKDREDGRDQAYAHHRYRQQPHVDGRERTVTQGAVELADADAASGTFHLRSPDAEMDERQGDRGEGGVYQERRPKSKGLAEEAADQGATGGTEELHADEHPHMPAPLAGRT